MTDPNNPMAMLQANAAQPTIDPALAAAFAGAQQLQAQAPAQFAPVYQQPPQQPVQASQYDVTNSVPPQVQQPFVPPAAPLVQHTLPPQTAPAPAETPSPELAAALANAPTTEAPKAKRTRTAASAEVALFRIFVGSQRPLSEWPAVLALAGTLK